MRWTSSCGNCHGLAGRSIRHKRSGPLRAALILLASCAWLGCERAPDPDRTAEQVLGEYERAFEDRDLERLHQVWEMAPQQSARSKEQVEESRRISLWLERRSARAEGEAIVVEFDQILDADRELGAREKLVARLVRDADGDWVMRDLRSRVAEPRTLAARARREPAAPIDPDASASEPALQTGAPGLPPVGSAPPSLEPIPAADTGGRPVAGSGSGSEGTKSRPAARSRSLPAAPSRQDVLALLSEYESAYAAGDLDRLARVWRMNAFERHSLQRSFASPEALTIDVEPGRIELRSDGALVDFEQITSALTDGSELRMRAHLRQRRDGSWFITRLATRQGEPLPSDGAELSSFDPSHPAAALRDFQQAFQARDLEALRAVWSLNPAEETLVRDVFARAADTGFRMLVHGIAVDGARATVDFDQRPVAGGGSLLSGRGRDRMRARIASDGRGGWVIAELDSR